MSSDYDEVIINDEEMEWLNDTKENAEDKYVYLLDKYMKLLKIHKNLCSEYSENTIIQSMNEMKERYEQLQKDTVPLYKYSDLDKKYKKQNKTITGVLVILEKTAQRLRDLDFNISNIPFDFEKQLYRCEIELVIICELLEQFVK